MKNKIVVFGGSGFLGSHVADQLSDLGYNVVIYDIIKSKFLRTDQISVVGDVLDQDLIRKNVKDSRFVYHFAALADIEEAQQNPVKAIKTNILSTTYIIDACKGSRGKRGSVSSEQNHSLIIRYLSRQYRGEIYDMLYQLLLCRQKAYNNMIQEKVSKSFALPVYKHNVISKKTHVHESLILAHKRLNLQSLAHFESIFIEAQQYIKCSLAGINCASYIVKK